MGIAKRLEARTRDGIKTRLTRDRAEDMLRKIMGLPPEIRPVRDREEELRRAREKFNLQQMGWIPKTLETESIKATRKMIQEVRDSGQG